jgi:hypothetical protein
MVGVEVAARISLSSTSFSVRDRRVRRDSFYTSLRALGIGLAVVVLDRISHLRDQTIPHEEREPLKVGQYLAGDKAP